MKAIAYVRVSTQGQVDEGVSLAAQEAKLRAWAELNNAESVRVFRDEGISGGRADNRPGLQAALAAVEAGDALVVYSLSRLSRSTRHLLTLADDLRERRVNLVSLSEKIDTTSATGELVFTLLAALAQFERSLARERTRAALAYKRTKHEKTGGDVPFGYSSRAGRLTPKAREQAAIADIIGRRQRGESLRAICAGLEASGIRRKGGAAAWHPEAVKRILARGAAA
jgi:DNA invertase Pin-like site-specific DNA recombinase